MTGSALKKMFNQDEGKIETGRYVFGRARKPRLFWFHFLRQDSRHLFVSGCWYCQIQTTWLIMFIGFKVGGTPCRARKRETWGPPWRPCRGLRDSNPFPLNRALVRRLDRIIPFLSIHFRTFRSIINSTYSHHDWCVYVLYPGVMTIARGDVSLGTRGGGKYHTVYFCEYSCIYIKQKFYIVNMVYYKGR